MAYAQRNGVLLYKPLKLSPRLPPEPPYRKRKPPRFPSKRLLPNKNAHPIIQSQAWRGRLLDLQNRNKRPRLANPGLNKQDDRISKMSDAQLMNMSKIQPTGSQIAKQHVITTSKGFFEKNKPVNRPARMVPNRGRGNGQPRRAPFTPGRQQRFPYQQRFPGNGGRGYRPPQQNHQHPPRNNPPFQLHPPRGTPTMQPPFRGPGISSPRAFSVTPQHLLGQQPVQSAPPVFTNHAAPQQSGATQHPVTNTQPAIQQFTPPLPRPGQPMFMPGQPPPPPEPYPTPMPYTELNPQVLAQPTGALPPARTPYQPLPQPFVHPMAQPGLPGNIQNIPGGSAAMTIKGSVTSSSTVDAAQDYFNSLPKPRAVAKKKRKRKFTDEPEPIGE